MIKQTLKTHIVPISLFLIYITIVIIGYQIIDVNPALFKGSRSWFNPRLFFATDVALIFLAAWRWFSYIDSIIPTKQHLLTNIANALISIMLTLVAFNWRELLYFY